MMSMDRIAEATSESHVQRKLSSRKWPSLSVGLIKSNFILIFSILITCFAGTIAQNAFPMEFASNATTNVKPGTPVNLTCSFKLIKDDFQNILFKLGAAQLYDYRSQGSFKGLQHDHFLSTNPNVDSVFWMTTKTSFCSDSSLNREYMCWVQNAAREFTQENVEVSYQGPSLEVIVGGKLIKNVGSTYSVILPHDQMNKDIEIKIVAKNVLNATSMKLSIEEGALPAEVTTNDDETLCIYERELIAMYKFPISGEYDLKYSGPPHDATIKVTVKDVPTTTTTTTVKTTTPDDEGLGIGAIIGISIGVFSAVVGSVCAAYCCCKKHKKKNYQMEEVKVKGSADNEPREDDVLLEEGINEKQTKEDSEGPRKANDDIMEVSRLQ